jgi:16S rRNA processing protein RimM
MTTKDVVIARIGKAHGLKGEVALLLRTDRPDQRLAVGTAFTVERPTGARTLTVASTRVAQERWYVRFDEVTDRTDAESLRDVDLVLAVDPAREAAQDPDAWYPEELKGLTVLRVQDETRELGTVAGLEHYPAQDVLIVRTPTGAQVMLPFVEELVPEVDLDRGVVLADPPGGLFEPAPDTADDED